MSDHPYAFEREEWRNAVEQAEDAGECDFDRPSKSDLYDGSRNLNRDDPEWEGDDGE